MSFFFPTQPLTTTSASSPVAMSSFLSDIIADAPDVSSTPLTLPMRRNTQPGTSDGDGGLSSSSESEGLQDDDGDDDAETQVSTQSS